MKYVVTDGGSAMAEFSIWSIQRITFMGFAGSDSFANDTPVPCAANGGDGRDTLYGGGGDDTLEGAREDDALWGRGGNDILYSWKFAPAGTPPPAAPGNDLLFGQAGADTLIDNTGNDYLNGGTENHELHGFAGRDTLIGSYGDDSLFGGGGRDVLNGGADQDLLDGGRGSDSLNGGSGHDSLFGGLGDDRIRGDAGDDQLFARSYFDDPMLADAFGTDTVFGGGDYDIAHGFDVSLDHFPEGDVEEFQPT